MNDIKNCYICNHKTDMICEQCNKPFCAACGGDDFICNNCRKEYLSRDQVGTEPFDTIFGAIWNRLEYAQKAGHLKDIDLTGNIHGYLVDAAYHIVDIIQPRKLSYTKFIDHCNNMITNADDKQFDKLYDTKITITMCGRTLELPFDAVAYNMIIDGLNANKIDLSEELTFKVIVRETLEREIEVQANNEAEAIDKVEQKYKDSTIVLDADDYVDSDIFIPDMDE